MNHTIYRNIHSIASRKRAWIFLWLIMKRTSSSSPHWSGVTCMSIESFGEEEYFTTRQTHNKYCNAGVENACIIGGIEGWNCISMSCSWRRTATANIEECSLMS